MLSGKVMMIPLVARLIKMIYLLYEIRQHFPKSYFPDRSDENIKIELGLSNFVTEDDLKEGTGVAT